MNLISLVCLSLIAIIIIIFVMLAFMPGEKYISLKHYVTFLLVAFVLVLIWVYNFEPTSIARWDLLEHYEELDAFRKYGWDYAWKHGEYKALYVSNLYFYLISRLPNNNLFPVIPLAIDFSIFLYIFKDCHNTVNDLVDFSDVAFITSVWICTFGFKLAVSGVRCVTAVAIFSLAIYWEYFSREKRVLSYVLYGVALFIHFFVIALILIRLISLIKKKIPVIIGLFIFVLYGDNIVRAIRNIISISYIQESLDLFLKYWRTFSIGTWLSDTATGSTLTVYLCFVLVALYLGYIVKCIRNAQGYCLTYTEYRIVDFASTLLWIAVAAAFNYVMLERLMYFLAYILLMILPIYIKSCRNKQWQNGIAMVMMVYLFFMNDIYIFMVNYTGTYFLAL